jgi:hypothetical protein
MRRNGLRLGIVNCLALVEIAPMSDRAQGVIAGAVVIPSADAGIWSYLTNNHLEECGGFFGER